MYDALVHCRIDLAQEWSGWKIRGRDLVSPAGDRISPARLAGLLFTEKARKGITPKKPAPLAELIRLPVRAREAQ